MPKSVEKCVAKLMADPKFSPKTSKTKSKSDIAWAICQSHAQKKECLICEIDDETLFQEAVEQIIKDISVQTTTSEESYTLDGINISIFNEAISKEDIDKINKFTVKPVESKDVTVYTALLIDDKITRNNTLYNKDFQSMLLSLPAGEGNFTGSPILFGETKDHQHTASSQVGRIFDAWQVVDKEKHFGVMAKVYVLNATNEDLISKINSGVLKEMSISTKVELPVCSICGQSILTCDHNAGQNGCYIIMSGKGFVAEASFVAVPGSNSAKILNEDETKNFLRLENLNDLVSPMINDSMAVLASGIVPKASFDLVNADIALMKETYANIVVTLAELDKKFKESENTVYPFDMLSALKGLKDNLEAGKAFVIATLAKYNLQMTDFATDTMPELVQGLKGENINLIVKLLHTNIDALGINLSKIEVQLSVVPLPTNLGYTGDINDMVNLVRFLNKKMDAIQVRIYKLKGKFDLDLEERNKLIQESIKFGILCGKFSFNEKTLAHKFFDNFSTEEIVILKDKFFTEGSSLLTPVKVEVKEEPKKEEPIKEEKPASLKEIAKKILNGGKNNV